MCEYPGLVTCSQLAVSVDRRRVMDKLLGIAHPNRIRADRGAGQWNECQTIPKPTLTVMNDGSSVAVST
jgi:hypothetical protein